MIAWPMSGGSWPAAMLAAAAAFLTRMVAVTSSSGARRPLIGKILDGALGLDPVVRVRGHGVFAERIALYAMHETTI